MFHYHQHFFCCHKRYCHSSFQLDNSFQGFSNSLEQWYLINRWFYIFLVHISSIQSIFCSSVLSSFAIITFIICNMSPKQICKFLLHFRFVQLLQLGQLKIKSFNDILVLEAENKTLIAIYITYWVIMFFYKNNFNFSCQVM